MIRRTFIAAALLSASTAFAQGAFPDKPVTLVTAFAPGSGPDARPAAGCRGRLVQSRVHAPVAQWIEQPPPKGQVARSIRVRGATI